MRIIKKLRIAILTSSYLIPWIKDCLGNYDKDYEISFLEYHNTEELPQLYQKFEDDYDGFITTGMMAKEFIIRTLESTKKPIYSINSTTSEYYRTYFNLLNQNRTLDLSKVMLDTELWLLDELQVSSNDFLKNHFSVEEQRNKIVENVTLEQLRNAKVTVLNNARLFFMEDKFDILVCRHSDVMEQLEEEKIPCVFVYPDKQNIELAFKSLLNEISLRQMRDRLPVVISIFSEVCQNRALAEINMESINLQKSLLEFNKNNTCDFLIRHSINGFEICTSLKTALRITNSFQECQLSQYLKKQLNFIPFIGYGIGYSIQQARENSLKALKEAKRTKYSYVINEQGDLIGPLDSEQLFRISSFPSQEVVSAAKKSGLSTVTIQKVLSVLDLLNTNKITTQELATKLNVTVVSANRFLNSLVKSGYAIVTNEKKFSVKGRPSKVYKIDFKKKE